MKNIYEVLRQKENEVALVKNQVTAIKICAPLLQGEDAAVEEQNARRREYLERHPASTMAHLRGDAAK